MTRLTRQRKSLVARIFMSRDMGWVKWFFALLMMVICFVGCASSSIQQLKQTAFQRTTSKEAYERIEPKLLALRSGMLVDSTGLEWEQIGIFQGEKLTGLIVVADGWLADLSGGLAGGVDKFGSLSSRKDNVVFGEHVYGYIRKKGVVVPKYLLRTRAELILEKEFKSLQNKNISSIGCFWVPGEKKEKNYFKNLEVHEVVALDFAEAAEEQISLKRIGTVADFGRQYYTRANFEKAQEKLAKLENGTNVYEVIKSLGGRFMASYGGEMIVLYMPGFLNYKGEFRWAEMRRDGLFVIWPFGYVERDKEIPKLALIFKNGKVYKIIPYESKEALKQYLSE